MDEVKCPWYCVGWGGPLDGVFFYAPDGDDGLPRERLRLDEIGIDVEDPEDVVPSPSVIVAELDAGVYVRNFKQSRHPSVPWSYRWQQHTTQEAMQGEVH